MENVIHEPQHYQCPFCLLIQGIENEHVLSRQPDIFYHDELVTAFIASHWWPGNPGHVLIIPNKHIENIYSLTGELSDRIHRLEIDVAKALKETYRCDGVSSRQHNEPSGGQDVWHYHLHVFPRYEQDQLYTSRARRTTVEERMLYSSMLREYFARQTARNV
ncbi:HIT family protein [Paenibacillus typhae]|uniref:HIT family protein n=1 Tax=Paenibacillus typhae TaxID=1174501 RepID=UPI001C8D4FBD|nr:HIT family protein [Paenibacillus typhae]MBY0010415.1 HIT family protein [Paenibacillus typhae]